MPFQKSTLAVLMVLTSTATCAQSSSFDISVDTTPLAGMAGFLAFDFLDGDGLVNNRITLSDFASNATLGTLSLAGDATGSLVPGPLVLSDSAFFDAALQEVTFGTVLSFRLTATAEGPFSPFPDAFSFFLLDDALLPFATDDPSGADTLLAVDIASVNPVPEAFGSTLATVNVRPAGDPVPAPATAMLVAMGFVLLRWRLAGRNQPPAGAAVARRCKWATRTAAGGCES